MMIRKMVAGITAPAVLMAGGCSAGSEGEGSHWQDQPVSVSETAYVQEVFDNDVEQWNARNKGKLAIKLALATRKPVTLRAAHQPDEVLDPDDYALSYSREYNSVEVSRFGYNIMRNAADELPGRPIRGVVQIVIAHEIGHGIQDEMYGIKPEKDESGRIFDPKYEQQADCFGGKIARITYDGDLASAKEIVEGSGGDDAHGTGKERFASFKRGYNGGDCLKLRNG